MRIDVDATRIGRVVATALLTAGAFIVDPAHAVIPRDDDVVTVSGSQFSDFLGRPVGQLFVFRWDTASGSFVPVPYQIDEVVDHVFNPSSPQQFTERMYDVLHEDDGLLDSLDELAVLYADAGTTRAPSSAAWPSGSDGVRYEIKVVDPRPNAPTGCRWLYLFAGSGLPQAGINYVSWNGLASGSIASDRFALDFTDSWLLTGYRVFGPCGSGSDLIDRVKGRALLLTGVTEDEERWNQQSAFLGGIVGPVRAIRYVRGAASAVNTVHSIVVYRNAWTRVVNLRVHPLAQVRLYTDWRPTPAGTMLFTPLNRSGVPIDGQNDASVSDSWVDWNVVRHPDGGAVTLYGVPASSLYATKRFQYRDDATFNDAIPTNPAYSDEDNASYGSNGIILDGLQDSALQAIVLSLRVFPQCGGVGDAVLGDEYQLWLQYPLASQATRQLQLGGPIRTLAVSRSGNDLQFTWQPVAGAISYRLYSAPDASLPHNQWTLVSESAGTQLTDPGAVSDPTTPFYSVVPVGTGGEGEW